MNHITPINLCTVLILAGWLLAGSVALGADQPAATAAENVLSDPARIPIAVWCQDPHNALKFKAVGINCYVGLWQGPTQGQLKDLESAGMPVLCEQNAEGLKPQWKKEIIGWIQGDEPDNAQELPGGKGYGPPILPEKIVARYQAMKAADNRPAMLNLGWGVAWDGWYGRGPRTNKPEDYPQYLKGCDIASFDIYPIDIEAKRKDAAGKLELVGQGVQRLVKWTDGKKPVWFCVQCTRISNLEAKPTPPQVRSQVWMGLINGASGFLYFVHQFKPDFVEAGLLKDEEMAKSVTAINAQVQKLAPILHAAAPDKPATWEVGGGQDKSTIAAITRTYDGATYVFAVSMTGQPVKVTFKNPAGGTAAEDIDDLRQLPMADGLWTDDFTAYQVHLYKIVAGPK